MSASWLRDMNGVAWYWCKGRWHVHGRKSYGEHDYGRSDVRIGEVDGYPGIVGMDPNEAADLGRWLVEWAETQGVQA